ncbi:MAG: hypothetical protein LRS49_00935 [Desulfurococcales archaeon]|nr:hypothetical protein [Desulfurococcales archaeon]
MAGAHRAEAAARVPGLAALAASAALLAHAALRQSPEAAELGAWVGLAHIAWCSLVYLATAPRRGAWWAPLAVSALTAPALALAAHRPLAALSALLGGGAASHEAVVRVTGRDPLEGILEAIGLRGPAGAGGRARRGSPGGGKEWAG